MVRARATWAACHYRRNREVERAATRPSIWPLLPILENMGNMGRVKTTVEIHDELLARAKRHAKLNGHSLRAVIEDALRLLLSSQTPRRKYVLPDLRVGNPGGADPLESYSWPELRDEIYG